MKKSRMVHYDLDLYSETLDNGLLINIVPKTTVKNIYVTFSTKYGSIEDTFIPLGEEEYYTVPMGVAHFLEHKVFEEEDGIDPFSYFSARGADSNANTSNYKTTYLFSGPTHFEDNLNYLLDFVQHPYFTDENVLKEKGIIDQEIKMLADNPAWKLYDKALFNSFKYHPIRYPIGGTSESIMKITKEDLYKCYNTFYHPSNMFITITGNVDPEETIQIIKENQSRKTFGSFKPIRVKTYDEPDTVNVLKEEVISEVSLPKVALSYKINASGYDINRLRIYLNLYFSLLLGTTSVFAEQLRTDKLISTGVCYDVLHTDKHLLYILDYESLKYQEVLDRLLANVGKIRPTREELERKKKSFKSGCIYRSDNIFGINSKINNNIINYGKVELNEFALIDSLNIDELNDILDDISFENYSIVIIKDK